MKLTDVDPELSPLLTFFNEEFVFGVQLVQTIHQALSTAARVMKGASPTTMTIMLVNSLLLAKVFIRKSISCKIWCEL